MKHYIDMENNGNGAGDEARTRYLHLGKVALYRMSYARPSLPQGIRFVYAAQRVGGCLDYTYFFAPCQEVNIYCIMITA